MDEEGRQALIELGRELVVWTCRNTPPLATNVGVHTYDDTLGENSPQALEARAVEARAYLDRLNLTDPGTLDAGSRVEWKLIWSRLRDELREVSELRDWERNPTLHAEAALFGCYFLVNVDFAPVERRAASLVSRLEAVPGFLEQARATVSDPIRPGVEMAVEETRAGKGFFKTVASAVASQVPALAPRLAAAADKAERALADFGEYLGRDLLSRARADFAIGKGAMDRILRERFFLDLDTERAVEIGQTSFDRIRGELDELALNLACGRGWRDILEDMKAEHPPADGILEAYRREVDESRAFILERGVLPLPPDESLSVVTTPSFERSLAPFAAYLVAPPLDPNPHPGVFWVTCPEPGDPPARVATLLRNHNRYACRLTSLHEGYPGHHLQSVHAARVPGVFRRLQFNTLMQEGWALYCEGLMHRLGYLDEPRLQLQMLRDQLWRAARVIIDGQLQLGRMTIEEGTRLLADGVAMSTADARAEVMRYALEPTQPLSYYIGRLEIEQLADRYGRKKGRLDLMEFHREFLCRDKIPVSRIGEGLFA